jgi:UDP-3-O-[3-hydroxymyristoyl] glucosamine N-acyltransferase
MPNSRFFNKKSEFLTLAQIIEITGAKPLVDVDLNVKISGVATLESAKSDEISFLNSGQYLDKFLASKAGFCLMDEKNISKIPQGMIGLVHKNPYFCYSQVANAFYETRKLEFSDKLIHESAQIGEGSQIAPNAFIGKNVQIGKNCTIGPSASIMEGCLIGDNCIINANATVSFSIIGNNTVIFNGAKIGQDGFGFAHNAGVNHKIIQLGIVEIGNDVEIGANSCVDRGAIENTKIGDGVKIDNLVQVAHNVVIGRGTVAAGCSAFAGSSKVGNYVQVGGNSSISGHITIGDGAKIAGMTGVIRDVEPMQVVAGIPAIPIKKWHRINAMLGKMIGSKTTTE